MLQIKLNSLIMFWTVAALCHLLENSVMPSQVINEDNNVFHLLEYTPIPKNNNRNLWSLKQTAEKKFATVEVLKIFFI